MRVVLDTNVFISSVLSKSGAPFTIIDACRKGGVDLIVSKPLLSEIGRVLHKSKLKNKHRWNDQQISRYLNHLNSLAELVSVDNIPTLTADPTDAIILATAEAGQADAIVTGDEKHLLPLKSYQDIPIITPKQCVEEFLNKKVA